MSSAVNIFYAEDDQDDVECFMEAIQDLQMNVALTHLKNGKELMDRLQRGDHYPQIIFLDINMPLKNGYECLREIRSTPALAKINVSILSTSSSEDVIQSMYHAGASSYIIKPDNYRHWTDPIRQAINRIAGKDEAGVETFVIKNSE